jgi:hypothetical protein
LFLTLATRSLSSEGGAVLRCHPLLFLRGILPVFSRLPHALSGGGRSLHVSSLLGGCPWILTLFSLWLWSPLALVSHAWLPLSVADGLLPCFLPTLCPWCLCDIPPCFSRFPFSSCLLRGGPWCFPTSPRPSSFFFYVFWFGPSLPRTSSLGPFWGCSRSFHALLPCWGVAGHGAACCLLAVTPSRFLTPFFMRCPLRSFLARCAVFPFLSSDFGPVPFFFFLELALLPLLALFATWGFPLVCTAPCLFTGVGLSPPLFRSPSSFLSFGGGWGALSRYFATLPAFFFLGLLGSRSRYSAPIPLF